MLNEHRYRPDGILTEFSHMEEQLESIIIALEAS